MTFDTPRALGFVLFLMAGGVIIYAMSMGDEGKKASTATAVASSEALPWVLTELTKPPYQYEAVKIGGREMRFKTKEECKRFGDARRQRFIEEGKKAVPYRCKKGV